MHKGTLCIIIVNWNSGGQLYDCLKSIANVEQSGFRVVRVVVIDNASTDESTDGLHDINLPLQFIRNSANRGFAAACNQGAQGSVADYLLFLNPDTTLFYDSLTIPISFIEQPENQHVGILGIQLVDDSRAISRTCARFPTPARFFSKMLGLDRMFPRVFRSHFMSEWDHQDNREVDHVIGAFFLVRRSLFEMLNGFDERFFVYLEDVDFSLRARQLGWSSYYLAAAQAYHKGGGTSEQIKAKRLFYSLRSRILYGYKHFGHFSATGLMLGTLLLEPIARLILGISRFSGEEIAETIKGYMMLWGTMPQWIKSAWRGSK